MADPVVANIMKSGAISWVAPVGEAFPDETSVAAGAAWGGTWARWGFTKEPLTLAYEDEEHEVEVEEFLAAVDRIKIGESAMLETVLSEFTGDYLKYALDGALTTTAAGAGQKGFQELLVGNDSQKPEFAIGFETIKYNATGVALPQRIGFYRCTLKLNGELKFSRRDDDHSGIPLQAKALTNTTTGRLIWSNLVTAPATS
jgi:hypothetical protein